MGDNNVLTGKISAATGSAVTIDTKYGKIEVDGTGKVGDEGSMAIRASAVKVNASDPGANSLEARLDFAEYLGDSVKLHMDLDGMPFLAKVHEERYAVIRAFEGKRVTVSWAREDGHLLEQ